MRERLIVPSSGLQAEPETHVPLHAAKPGAGLQPLNARSLSAMTQQEEVMGREAALRSFFFSLSLSFGV